MSDPLNRARDQRAGLRAAIGGVERSLASPAPGRASAWSEELRQQLEVLSAALDQHVKITEADDGLLNDIIQIDRRLVRRVDLARQDHAKLRKELDVALAAVPIDEGGVAGVRDQVVAVLSGLVRHRQAGADMVYEAYNVDIEAGD